MFGFGRRKREKRELKRGLKELKRGQKELTQQRQDWETQQPERFSAEHQQMKSQAARDSEEAKMARQQARQEGRKYAEELLSRDVQGLTPTQRNTMQYEANKGIQRQMQGAQRRLLGEQGRRGIVGKGGVGYAQMRDLEKLGSEAQGQVQRDVNRINEDLALKKLAAMFNIEQGEAAQSGLDRQLAQDQLELEHERRRQRSLEDKFNRLFSRV